MWENFKANTPCVNDLNSSVGKASGVQPEDYGFEPQQGQHFLSSFSFDFFSLSFSKIWPYSFKTFKRT